MHTFLLDVSLVYSRRQTLYILYGASGTVYDIGWQVVASVADYCVSQRLSRTDVLTD